MRLDPLPAAAIEPAAGDFVTLRRGHCYGSCATYSVTLRGDGRVDAVGEANVAYAGPHSWTIDPALARRALLEFLRADAFTSELPISGVSDLPTAWLTVSVGDRQYTVEHYGGGWEFAANPHDPARPARRSVDGGVNERQANASTAAQLEWIVDFVTEVEKRVVGCPPAP